MLISIRFFNALCAVLLLLNTCDAVSTYIAIGRGAQELNPAMKLVMDWLTLEGFVVFKLVAMYWLVSRIKERKLWKILVFSVLLYAFAVLNNIAVIMLLG